MEAINIIRALTLVSLISGMCTAGRSRRKAGDQPPTGKCAELKWGGSSSLHWYVCCNNCNQTDTSCNGTTYQTASDGRYCGACGVDTREGDGNKGDIYACGGCSGQNTFLKSCSSGLNTFTNLPGFCWAFTTCFERNCKHSYRAKMATSQEDDIPPNCFNLRCDPGETVNNCPTDCCGTVEPKCDWSKDNGSIACSHECCGESTCCNTNGAGRHVTNTWIVLLCVAVLRVLRVFS